MPAQPSLMRLSVSGRILAEELEEGRREMARVCPLPKAIPVASYLLIENRKDRMNLPDAPITHQGFFVTHFLTMRDREKSKDFYVRILGGQVMKPENPCYIKLANTWIIILNSGGGPTPDKPRTYRRERESLPPHAANI